MSDTDYLARRAEQEAYLAMEATNRAAVAAHYQLSTFYLDRLHEKQEAAEQEQAE